MQFYKLCQCYVKSLHICVIILKLTKTHRQVHIILRKISEWHAHYDFQIRTREKISEFSLTLP